MRHENIIDIVVGAHCCLVAAECSVSVSQDMWEHGNDIYIAETLMEADMHQIIRYLLLVFSGLET